MKLLVEGYSYEPEVVRGAIPENKLLLTNGKVSIEHVGYYRSAGCNDFVFFLPKVLLNDQDKVFGNIEPEDIVDLNLDPAGNHPKLTKKQTDFLYEFAVWVYRAISRYDITHSGSTAIWKGSSSTSGAFKRRYVTNTLLDVILALQRFNRDNQDYFLFKVQEKHSGNNKINWTRTIAHSPAYVQNGVPIYLDVRNKKKIVDFDEELLVIFYSILEYVRVKFGFDVKINMSYQLITGARFERYLEGYGETRLRQIKYKYFSDRDLTLWELCFAFFNKAHHANIANDQEEYLLAKNFEIVFESMIDDLIGDSRLDKFKELRDGKEIDHLYLDDSLTHRGHRNTFYVADSKYYKSGNQLGDESIQKQFTYAKDLLQLNLDLFFPGNDATDNIKRKRKPFEQSDVGMLRDENTEGYDIIPNFFISATMDEDFNYDKDKLAWHNENGKGEHQSIHFTNRLFDRDTLLLFHYDVNFLYVLKLYAQNDETLATKWKNDVHEKFRSRVRDEIAGRFEFKAIMPHEGVDALTFFKENFKYTLGKVYRPYLDVDGKPVYMLAVQKPNNIFEFKNVQPNELGESPYKARIEKENEEIVGLIESSFHVVNVDLGEDPTVKLQREALQNPRVHSSAGSSDSGVQVVSNVAGRLSAAVISSGWCPCSKTQCPDPGKVKVLVLPFTMGAKLFKVDDEVAWEECNSAAELVNYSPLFNSVTMPSYPCYLWKVDEA